MNTITSARYAPPMRQPSSVTTNDRLARFRAELRGEVSRIRRYCLSEGTTALGFDCLFQLLRWQNLPSVPQGTNAVYFIKQELRAVCTTREFAGFIL
jgi:hypothetical protein